MTAADISRIRVAGFRSIEDAEFPLDRINLLIGSNGSGKSNILGIFELLHAITTGKLQTYIAESGGPEVLFRYGTRQTNKIILRAEFGDSFYEIHLHSESGSGCRIASEQLTLITGDKTLKLVSSDTIETGIFAGVQMDASWESFRLHLQSWTTYRFQSRCTGTEDERRLTEFLFRLKQTAPEYFEKITDTIRLIFPQFGDFLFREENENRTLLWTDTQGGGHAFGLQVLSGGTARFINLAVLLLQPTPPRLILIDEPELGLHPFAIAVLADLMKLASRSTQLIVSTQSVQFLNAFGPAEESTGSRILIVDMSHGTTTITVPTPETLADWIEEYSIGELWQMNVLGGNP
ncbi:AAA family ATPase [Methanocorpusculum sp. MG]|uniref:AAA family ATPase n=1 Tax=Methanocorpusculum petauri TaxID=3002863 RepID=A0ABT4IHR6_9EURY|nr:AAA family ATPase [Methanocorpusculum petauri]MCZ0861291.1 AAA family ATPase [Methanocorpusculum petauri]MDE2443003.1 AAA family ATPase [Methanocorpusculum sp.]